MVRVGGINVLRVYNCYGIGTRYENGSRIGYVEVFKTKRDRDAWIDAEEWDGNYHREVISSAEARRFMLDVLNCFALFGEPKSYVERYGSMEQIVEAYLSTPHYF